MSPEIIIALATLAVTTVGVGLGLYGLWVAIRTLQSAETALRLATDEAKTSAAVSRAQFWIMIRGVMANYDDIHAKFRPGGAWSTDDHGPDSADEWARTELYMGLFEYCEQILEQRLLDEREFRDFYEYRLGNIVANKKVVVEKLEYNCVSWKKFRRLCERFNIEIPTYNGELIKDCLEKLHMN
jgi:hypothetical protein